MMKQVETGSWSRHEASRNTKQVETQSKSKHEADQKEVPKQAEKWDETKRQVKLKTTEIQRQMLPTDASVNKETYRRGSQKAHREAVHRDTQRSWPRFLLRSRPVKSYRQGKRPPGWSLSRHTEKSTKKSSAILLKPPIESAPMKSTG